MLHITCTEVKCTDVVMYISLDLTYLHSEVAVVYNLLHNVQWFLPNAYISLCSEFCSNFAGHVGGMRLHRSSLRTAPTTYDAKSQGCREVYSTLCVCAGSLPVYQLCALDSSNCRWRQLSAASNRQRHMACHGAVVRGCADRHPCWFLVRQITHVTVWSGHNAALLVMWHWSSRTCKHSIRSLHFNLSALRSRQSPAVVAPICAPNQSLHAGPDDWLPRLML